MHEEAARMNNWRKQDEWFDWESKVARRNVQSVLRKFRRTVVANSRLEECLQINNVKTSVYLDLKGITLRLIICLQY